MIRCTMLCLLLLWVNVALAGPAPSSATSLSDPLAEQLQTLQAATQAQIDAVMLEMKDQAPAAKADLERRIVELKHQGEISRLTLLLDAAHAAGDAARVADLQKALEQWQNPPQMQILPQNNAVKPLPVDAAAPSPVPSSTAK